MSRQDRYEKLMVDSLTLTRFPGGFRKTPQGYEVAFVAEPGSVTVIAFDHVPAE